MPRIAVISDIHSNLQALEAVLARIAALDCAAVYCLGDIVGYGAHPAECIARVRALRAVCVQGNHDGLVADGGVDPSFNPRSLVAVAHNRDRLDPESLLWLARLPIRRDLEGGTVLAHGSPGDRDRYLLMANDLEAVRREQEEALGPGVTFFGHTHQPVCHAGPGDTHVGAGTVVLDGTKRVLINPGSVGQPRTAIPARPSWSGSPRAAAWTSSAWSTTSRGPARPSSPRGCRPGWATACGKAAEAARSPGTAPFPRPFPRFSRG